ncbi:hypothetical protein A2125_02525 [Candidatus Woesebacteria bacterium GWB1_43_5]|uniref:Vitamin B12-dependent ribonucleotide reductase n=1 Tax=Candidatus Woesebacteria bacterium GWB1_43_5 TaxID=1802474 RepID=A0A1F7WT84_9BACT|nr:MAG: hypothetical protein A2125_02525 [Candidatus Woesebacteria bacterium GWB1_43_5]
MLAIANQHIVKSEKRTLNFVNPMFEDVAKSRGFYSEAFVEKVIAHGTVRDIESIPEDVRKVFGTAHEIHPDWHVRMQAAFQKYTDNAVSKTINLPHDATIDDVKRAYDLAWETGCRGITIFRDGSKSEQVLNLGVKNQEEKTQNALQSAPHKIWVRPMRVSGSTYKLKTPVGTAFITINEDESGNPFEVFINIGKAGSDVAAMAEAMGRVISKALKFNGNLTSREKALVIFDQLKGIGGRTSVGFGSNKVRSLPDAISIALASHCGFRTNGNGLGVELSSARAVVEAEEAPAQSGNPAHAGVNQDPTVAFSEPIAAPNLELFPKGKAQGDICPSCGKASLVCEEGCAKCYACGHSEC